MKIKIFWNLKYYSFASSEPDLSRIFGFDVIEFPSDKTFTKHFYIRQIFISLLHIDATKRYMARGLLFFKKNFFSSPNGPNSPVQLPNIWLHRP